MYDVIIIGAGVSGAATARELSRYKVKACVIEKEEDVCCGTSKANSAIVHAGYDAAEGSLMAKLNVRGNQMMEQLSKDLDFPFKKNGSLVAGKLKKAGLIKSTRGAQGGYRLAKPAAEISVGDILRALEGELGAVDCQGLKPEGGCESSDFCVTKLVWQRINDSIAKAVDEITLEELMAEAKKSQERKREMEQSGQYINSQDKADTKRKC